MKIEDKIKVLEERIYELEISLLNAVLILADVDKRLMKIEKN